MDSPKFLCDQMLARLGRWLRAAGYDTIIAEKGIADDRILAHALDEHRFLISRDRHFLQMQEANRCLIFIKSNLLSDCIHELNQKTNINWLYRPFSRCLICNTMLIVPSQSVIESKAPDELKMKPFTFCPHCDKLFWEGSHTKRMLAKLKSFSS